MIVGGSYMLLFQQPFFLRSFFSVEGGWQSKLEFDALILLVP